MTMKPIIALVFLVLAVDGFAQPAADEEEAGKAIDALREGLISRFTKGDIDGLLQHLETNVVVTWQERGTRGR